MRLLIPICLVCVLVVAFGCGESEEADLRRGSTATFVGDEACANCHADIYTSYHETGMARSVSRFDAGTAPEQFNADGRSPEVCHDASGYCYVAFVRGDTLFQREFRRDDPEHERTYAASHVIGSGNATRSYFMVATVQDDSPDVGYYTEMPLTWYVERELWDLSPGYEQTNDRFERPIVSHCMTCHNGLLKFEAGPQNFYTEVPLGITCERCHGPASDHVEMQLAGGGVEGEPDPTIVNPARLDAGRQLAVCQQCHLSGETVFKPGEDPTTFRPGMALSDNRAVFARQEQVDDPEAFGISSHALRMMQSVCFTATRGLEDALTCTTCHDPHRSTASMEADHFNTTCRSCHGSEAHPTVLRGARPDVASVEEAMVGNCVSCHMQRGGTSDIPHVLFTDHWIRRTLPPPRPPEDIERGGVRSIPFTLIDVTARERALAGEEERVDEADSAVELGIAYFHFYDSEHRLPAYLPTVAQHIRRGLAAGSERSDARMYLGRALMAMDSLSAAESQLTLAAQAHTGDPETLYWLGAVRLLRGNAVAAIEALEEAVAVQPGFSEARFKLAEALADAGRVDEALASYTQALRMDPYRHASAWNNMGFLYLQAGNMDDAAQALRQAVGLDPRFVEARTNLGAALINSGNLVSATSQFEAALRYQPDYAAAIGNLGVIYMRQSRRSDARRMFERLLALNPGDQNALAYLNQLNDN